MGLVIDIAIHMNLSLREEGPEGTIRVSIDRTAILAFYCDHVISSRTALPTYSISAFDGFVKTYIEEQDFDPKGELVKAMDKALLRNPELSLASLNIFFIAYASPLCRKGQSEYQRSAPQDLVNTMLLPCILRNIKSTNHTIRSLAACLFETLLSPFLTFPHSDAANLILTTADGIRTILRTQKSASPEHRIMLCQLLQCLNCAALQTPAISSLILEALSASISKESSEAVLKVSLQTYIQALLPLLSQDKLDGQAIMTLTHTLSANDQKPPLRRQHLVAVGDLFWNLYESKYTVTSAMRDLATACLPGLEVALKSAHGGSSDSVVEGWIAVALLKGIFEDWGLSRDPLERSPAFQNLLVAYPKPSFLLAEKSYKKMSNQEDELWLIRAIKSVLMNARDIKKIVSDAQVK